MEFDYDQNKSLMFNKTEEILAYRNYNNDNCPVFKIILKYVI